MSQDSENLYSAPNSDLEVAEPEQKRISVLWVAAGLFFLVGVYGALFIPALSGTAPRPNTFSGSLFWHTVFFVILWKRRLLNPWQGGAIGAAAGIAAFLLALFISGAAR